jgi:hypothetical protein
MTFKKNKITYIVFLIFIVFGCCSKQTEDNKENAFIAAQVNVNTYLKYPLYAEFSKNPQQDYTAEKINDKWRVRGWVKYKDLKQNEIKSDFMVLMSLKEDKLQLDSIYISNNQ